MNVTKLITIFFFIILSLNGIGQSLSTDVTSIAMAIAESRSLGFDQDAQHTRFKKLNTLASAEELVILTDHDSPAVRGYAFWALAKRNYSDLKSIFIAHLDDNVSVFQKNGCMVGKESVISFMKQVVTPYMYDPDCMKLDDSIRALVK